MKTGRLIIVDGVDGCFKTTLCKEYASKHDNCEYVREPGGNKLAESIRDTIMELGDSITPDIQLSLFQAARVILFKQKIEGLLNSGKDVIMDRSFVSSIVYQGRMTDVLKLTKELYGEYHASRAIIVLIMPNKMADVCTALKDRKINNAYDKMFDKRAIVARYKSIYEMSAKHPQSFGSWAKLTVFKNENGQSYNDFNYENLNRTINYMIETDSKEENKNE